MDTRGNHANEGAARGAALDVQELVLLGLCALRPIHGYEARRIVEAEFEPFTPVKGGTVYYTLGKLRAQGLVSQRTVGGGSHPPKQLFRTTARGRRRLKELLHASLYQPDRPFFAFDLGLFFIHLVGYEEVLRAIRERRRRIQGYRAFMAGVDEAYPALPFNIRAIKERGRFLVEAADRYYEDLEREVLGRSRRDRARAPGPETIPTTLDLRPRAGSRRRRVARTKEE